MARCSLKGHQFGLYVLAVGADEAVFAGHPQPGSAPSGDEAVEAEITDINGAAFLVKKLKTYAPTLSVGC